MQLRRARRVPVDALHMIRRRGGTVAAVIQASRSTGSKSSSALPALLGKWPLHLSRLAPEPQSERRAPLPVSGGFHYGSPVDVGDVAFSFFLNLKSRLGRAEGPGPRGDSTSHLVDDAVRRLVGAGARAVGAARPVRAASAPKPGSRGPEVPRSTSCSLFEGIGLADILARSW